MNDRCGPTGLACGNIFLFFLLRLGGFQFMVLLPQPPEAGMEGVRLVILLGSKNLTACGSLNFM